MNEDDAAKPNGPLVHAKVKHRLLEKVEDLERQIEVTAPAHVDELRNATLAARLGGLTDGLQATSGRQEGPVASAVSTAPRLGKVVESFWVAGA